MECAREGCGCPMGESRFEYEGRVYCCEKCATAGPDERCPCSPGDCAGS